MTDENAHRATLAGLNRNYVRSVDEADVGWFDANLAKDFLNTNPDGSIADREGFLAQIGRGSTVKNIREHDVLIRLFWPHAVIHARTSYLKSDIPTAGIGSMAAGSAFPHMFHGSKRLLVRLYALQLRSLSDCERGNFRREGLPLASNARIYFRVQHNRPRPAHPARLLDAIQSDFIALMASR
jgi:hypothetical protein